MKPKSNSDLLLMLMMAVASIFFLASAAGDFPRVIFASVILAASLASIVGFFARVWWSRPLAGAVFLLTAGFMVYNGATRGWGLTRILGPCCCVCAAWGYLRRSDDATDEEEGRSMISIVGLVSELPFLEESVLVRHMENAWGITIDPTDDEPENFVVGEAPLFVIRARDCMFLVHYFERPYFDDPEEVSASMRDIRVAHVVEQHKGWFSVDLMSADDDVDATDPANYAMLGRLFAEIVDDHCLALVFPAFQTCIPWEAGFEESLRTDNPLSALNVDYLPVVRVDANDPRMLAAVDEARSRFDEFVSAFENRESEELSFAVKAPIEAGDNTEVIWITVSGIENGIIYGALANDPVDLGRLKMGDRVKSRVEDLNDWMYTNSEDDAVGGFTIAVLSEIYAEPVPESDDNEVDPGAGNDDGPAGVDDDR